MKKESTIADSSRIKNRIRMEIISGPTRTGKSEQLLDRIESLKSAGKHFILLLPTGDHVNHYKLQIAKKHGGLFGSSIVDLTGLIKIIESRSDETMPKRSPNYLFTNIINELIQERLSAGDLKYFKEATELKSFGSELNALFNELLQSCVTPEDLLGLELSRSRELKLYEINLLYGDYMERCSLLNKGNKYQRLNSATDILETDKNMLAEFDTLIIDGFYDYTPQQKKLFRILFDRVENVLTAQLYEDGRDEVFAFTRRNQSLFEGFNRLAPKLGKWDTSPIAQLRENIFESITASSRSQKDIPLKILVESGTRKLVEEIARQVKFLIVKNKLPPSRIGIMYRSGDEYPSLIRGIFPRFGIPVTIQQKRSLLEEPVVSIVLKLLMLNPERNFGYELRTILRSKFLNIEIDNVQPDTEFIIKLLQIAGANDGKGESLKRLRDYYKDSKAARRISAEEVDKMNLSINQISEIFEKFSPPKGTNKLGAYRSYIEKIIEFSDIRNQVEENPFNKNALNQLMNRVDELTEQLRDKELSFSDFRKIFREDLEEQKTVDESNLAGGVEVVNVENARWRRFDTLFICGLIEGSFPVLGQSARLIDSGIREKIDERRNSSLHKSVELIQEEERLLYYITMSRADERIFLCYPSVDSDGRELSRSNFVDKTAETYKSLAGGNMVPNITGDVKKFTSDTIPFCSEDELLRSMALKGIGKIEEERELHLMIQFKLMGEAALRRSRNVSAYSGYIEEPEALAALAAIQEKRGLWSATELERYGKCPFLYLTENIFKLEKPEEFSEQVSPMELGAFYHEVLKKYYEKQMADSISEAETNYEKDLNEAIDEALKNPLYQKNNLAPILWEIELGEAEQNLLSYIKSELRDSDGKLSPIAVEAGFGGPKNVDGSTYSTDLPLIIDENGTEIRIKGRIDRVDANEDRSEYSVLDYKSGQIPSRKNVQNGVNLQLPIYVEAVRQLMLNQYQSQPRNGYYFSLKNKNKLLIYDVEKGLKWNEVFKSTKEYIAEYVNNIREGKFPVEPKDCKNPCEYAELCRLHSYST